MIIPTTTATLVVRPSLRGNSRGPVD